MSKKQVKTTSWIWSIGGVPLPQTPRPPPSTLKGNISPKNIEKQDCVLIKYQIYCAQIKIHLSGCLNSPSWAAVQRQRAANLLQVQKAKKPLQSREHPDLSRPLSLDQGHIEIVPQLMVHVCPEVSNPKPWATSTP